MLISSAEAEIWFAGSEHAPSLHGTGDLQCIRRTKLMPEDQARGVSKRILIQLTHPILIPGVVPELPPKTMHVVGIDHAFPHLPR
jgi:hypothetical protein